MGRFERNVSWRKKYGGLPFDLVLALLLVVLSLTVERATQGRLSNITIVLWVGLGGFLLLRLGAIMARAGRTLGCLFVFALTWLLPCTLLLYLVASPDLKVIVRDSLPFFILAGFILILIMIVTLERTRSADEARLTIDP
ncbi:MAG: hypothetical protein ACRDIB_08465 [Ardenticatenaceae bacterium]